MKEEKIFRYEGSREEFKPVYEMLESIGLTVKYAESQCTDMLTVGFIQRQEGERSIDSLIQENPDVLSSRLRLEESLRKCKC